MNILHGNLKAVKAPCLGGGHFGGKVPAEVLVDDPVRGGEEGENVGDKVAFVGGETVPVLKVGG